MGRKYGSGVRRTAGSTRQPWSVRTYLVLIVVAAVVAVAAASAYGFLWSTKEARDRAMDAMSLQAKRAATATAGSLSTAQQTVAGLAAQPDLRKVFAQPDDCSLQATPGLRLDIVSPAGDVACSSDPEAVSARVHAGSDWLDAALRSPEPAVDRDATDAATGRRAVVVTAPVDKAEPGAGAIAMLIDVPGAASQLARDYASSSRVGFALVDRTTHAVLSASGTERPDGARFPARTSGDWEGVDGTRRIFGSADVAGTDWQVFAGVSRASVLADARGALTRNLLVGVLALLVLIAAVWMLNRRVAGPLKRVIDAVSRAARDVGGTRVEEAGTAELVTLAREFNSMLDLRAGHEAQLLYQATHDPLTGLPNKALLGDQLAEALAGGDGVAVFCVGLERLDIVADGFGHDAGDRVVVEVATRLSETLDAGDALARFGAAEFVVVCATVRDEQVGAVAERLLRCLERPFHGPEAGIVVKGAIGVAIARTPATSPEQLLREADSAMREARVSGRGWMLFDDALQVRATRHLEIEHDLWQALRRDELTVHYQPLLEVGSGRIVAAEALVRWQHPERGLVPPLDFIPTAEETGQITAIGQFVLTQACQQAAAWSAAGHPLRISVNVAVGQLRDPGFPGLVERILAEAGLAPDQLCLEITESSLMREAGQGSAELARLKQLGVDLSMDDFGTGYSSLAYLHHLPVDELKVDRSFISRLGRAGRDRHLVEAIVGMARALDLAVVAEGVETDEQLQFLGGLGCELAQGYLFAPAVPATELLALLQHQRHPGLLATTL
jgi:diguanylate cyclase (GGDEF)-like protein